MLLQRTGLYQIIALCVVSGSWAQVAHSADAPAFNLAVVKYCEAKLGKRVGGGECSHLANEALRVAGAEFTQVSVDGKRIPDSPEPGDYVWGKRIKIYSFDDKNRQFSDSDPAAKCLPGDIIQFHNVKIADGTTYPHHTAVVRTVDDAGHPTGIYQQNVKSAKGGDGRIVQKGVLKTLKMVGGQMMIYRPEVISNPMPFQFTWTNNSKSATVEFVYCGRKGKLGAPNTSDSYRTVWASRGGDIVIVDGNSYPISTRKAYEFYTNTDGKIALREIE